MLAEVALDLAPLVRRFEHARDARCVFAHAYLTLTRELERVIATRGFADPLWVAQLARVFADYYLRALRLHDEGKLPPGAWSTVFRAADGGRTSVLEDLLLGMTAHIVNDLPRALCDVGLSAPGGVSRIADYQLLNEVLGGAIDSVQDAVTRRYDPLLGVLDRVLESYDEILTGYGIRVSRATAWYNAQRLLDPTTRAATLVALERSPEATLRALLDPPTWSLRVAFRGARLLGRRARRWPGEAERS